MLIRRHCISFLFHILVNRCEIYYKHDTRQSYYIMRVSCVVRVKYDVICYKVKMCFDVFASYVVAWKYEYFQIFSFYSVLFSSIRFSAFQWRVIYPARKHIVDKLLSLDDENFPEFLIRLLFENAFENLRYALFSPTFCMYVHWEKENINVNVSIHFSLVVTPYIVVLDGLESETWNLGNSVSCFWILSKQSRDSCNAF